MLDGCDLGSLSSPLVELGRSSSTIYGYEHTEQIGRPIRTGKGGSSFATQCYANARRCGCSGGCILLQEPDDEPKLKAHCETFVQQEPVAVVHRAASPKATLSS
jgi:hypothetical protein